MVLSLAFVKNKDRPPTGWRYSKEVTGLAKVLQTLLSDSEYDKVGRLLPGCLPTARHLRDRFSFAPSVEGFQLSQFAKLKATWIHEISLVSKVPVAKAAELLQQAPFAALADDETSVRQAFRYQPDADHIIGPIHDNILHRWLPIPIESFVEAKAKHQLADKANCYVLKALAFPQLPAFLLAVVPTYRGNSGHFRPQVSLRRSKPGKSNVLQPLSPLFVAFELSPTAVMAWARLARPSYVRSLRKVRSVVPFRTS